MAVNERFDVCGRSVIITGGGKGIGKVYVEEFAKAGARVTAADIDVAAAQMVAATLSAAGCEAVGLGVDMPASKRRWPWRRPSSIGSALFNTASLMSVLPRGAVMFLSSSASDFMTGQTINVDGGKAMH